MTDRVIIGIDPGLDTGVAIRVVDSPGGVWFHSKEVTEAEFGLWLEEVIIDHRGFKITIVCEDFFNSVATAKRAPSPWSRELIGVIKFLCRKYGLELPVMQMPSSAKKVAPDARLKHSGWFLQTKEGHANDASRLVMWYCLKHNLIDRRELVGI
jgi:hypothetical protein